MLRQMLRSLLFGSALVVQGLFAELTVEQRVQDFDTFWQTYKDAYVFFDLKKGDYGVDWDAIREQYIEKLQNSTSDIELYAAITEAQTLLRDGHCYNGAISKIRETEPIFFQRAAFALVEGNRIVVSTVVPKSALDEAGVKSGDELIQFDGKTIRQLAREYRKLHAASSEGQFWNSFAGQLYIHNPLLGKPASPKAKLVFRSAPGNTIEVESRWESAAPTGKPEVDAMAAFVDSEKGVSLDDATLVQIEGPLPMDARIFKDANIGYIKIETWMKTEDPIEQMEQVMTAMKDTDGLVVDMRGNGGGVGPWGVLFANYFIPAQEKGPNHSWMERNLSETFFRRAFPQISDEQWTELLSTPENLQYLLDKGLGVQMTVEEVSKHFVDGKYQPFYVNLLLNERRNTIAAYEKPVYALTDGGCYSTTDIFLTILNEFNRITVVGTPNGAGSGSPIPFVLPNSGLQVYVPHARAYPPMGAMIEGRPLEPKIRVSQTIADLQAGVDTVLTEAVRELWNEINPSLNAFASEEFNLGETQEVYSNLQPKAQEWGHVPTPDWAIGAAYEQVQRQKLEMGLKHFLKK